MIEEEEDNKVNVSLYEPHKYQKLIHQFCSDAHPATFILGIAGRQSGKSFSALFQTIYWSLTNNNCKLMWVSPTIQQAQYIFLQLLTELQNAGLVVRKNQSISGMYLELINGSVIYVRSANSEHSLRGYTVQKLILDEAAYADERVFREVLLPMLNTQKPGIKNKILLITTPRGKLNWIYKEYLKIGKDKAYAGVKWTSYDNPARNEEIIQNFKNSLSEQAFNQEFLANWQDQYSLFTNVIDCATIPNIQTEPIPNERYVMAVDPGLVNDYTSITVMNLKGHVVYIERFKRIINNQLKNKVANLYTKWKPIKLVFEVTGIGRPIANDLKHEFQIYNIEEFETSQARKELIVEELANAFDNQVIKIPKNPDYLVKELLDFTAYPTSKGKLKYEASSGHDDAVISLSMCHHYYKKYAKSNGRYVIR